MFMGAYVPQATLPQAGELRGNHALAAKLRSRLILVLHGVQSVQEEPSIKCSEVGQVLRWRISNA